MVNTAEVRERMRSMGVNYEDMALELGISPVTVRQKVYNVRELKLSEAQVIKRMLNIEDDEFARIFLSQKVRGASWSQ